MKYLKRVLLDEIEKWMDRREISKEALKEGINLKAVSESAIRRAIEKREFLKRTDKLLKGSRLTEADAIRLGRRVNASLAKRYAIR